MGRDRGEPAAVRVYTVCDESKYLIVRNVPALGCGSELERLFASYGHVEECKPMDAEDCEQYTDVFFIKFSQVSNARFAKRKLDESVFLGNRLEVSYAPQFESLSDTKEKLEIRRMEVARQTRSLDRPTEGSTIGFVNGQVSSKGANKRNYSNVSRNSHDDDPILTHVSSNKDYFTSPSMNAAVNMVREKLNKIQSSSPNFDAQPTPKQPRSDGRRRI